VGGRRHLPLRPYRGSRGRIRHRHAAAHRQRLAAHRPRVQLHAHRPHRPLPAHAGQGRLLPDRVGRQRPGHRASRPERHRRPLRPVAAVRRGLPAAVSWRRPEGPSRGSCRARELRRAVSRDHRERRAAVRGPVPPPRSQRRLVADLHHHRRTRPPRQPASVPAQPGQRSGVPAGRTHPVGHRRAHRGRAGRDGRPEMPGAYHKVAFHRTDGGGDILIDTTGPSCCPAAWPWSRTPTTSATRRCSAPRCAPRCSTSRSRSSPITSPSPTRAPASR
jgi:hypothetical protein